VARQLLDAAGGTDSNYRAACRSRSPKESIARVAVAAEEADECVGWLRALVAARIGDSREATALMEEARELTAIFSASEKTARRNQAEQGVPEGKRAPRSRLQYRNPPSDTQFAICILQFAIT
jgi:four helix bundle protein